MAASKPSIAIARPKGANLAFGAAGVGLASAAVALVVARTGLNVISYIVLAAAAVLMLGGISALYGVVSKGPALLVSDEGIVDRTSLFGVGLVRWSEIAGLASFRFYAQRYLLIFLKDPRAFATHLRPLPLAVVTINRVISPAPICIPSAMLPDIDGLLARIQKQYGAQLDSHAIHVRRAG